MKTSLLNYIKDRFSLSIEDLSMLEKHIEAIHISAHTLLLESGKKEHYIYFLTSGYVRGYQNIDGKIVVQHLVEKNNFFTSLDSFMNETPSEDYFETVTDCELVKISKSNFLFLSENTGFWNPIVEKITNEHLACKMERVKDFQVLTAKERYLKFIEQYPQLALNVSVDSLASFLGIEPQSLSRIRKQVAI